MLFVLMFSPMLAHPILPAYPFVVKLRALTCFLLQPCPDFPSIKWIGANSVDYDTKVINKIEFKRVLIKIPSCMEDKSNEKLEEFVQRFAKDTQKEMFIGLPY